MSFIGNGITGKLYEAGWFLAHEECERKTKEFAQADATTASDGSKYIPMGTVYSVTTGTGQDAVTDYIGFVYEDVDVTKGNAAGSVVTKGVVYEDRLPETLTSTIKTALEAKGFTFIANSPSAVRPNWTNG